MDVMRWADELGRPRVSVEELASGLAELLAAQQTPPRPSPQASSSPGRAGPPLGGPALAAAATPVVSHEGGWDAVDSAFTDEQFKAGCLLFTQFYRGASWARHHLNRLLLWPSHPLCCECSVVNIREMKHAPKFVACVHTKCV